jgi:ubiquinone/menaquinone biosynthesis C-methylase UbiE
MKDASKEKESLIRKINCVYHDAEHSEYDDRHSEIIIGEVDWWNKIGIKHIKNNFRGRNHLSLLDIGTGTGFVIKTLTRHLDKKYQVFAYDLSQSMLHQAKKTVNDMNENQYNFICGDAEVLPFPDDFFDVITINGVLHHLPNHRRCLQQVTRTLKSKGILIIAHEPNNKFFKSPIVRFMATVYKKLGGSVVKVSDRIQEMVNNELVSSGYIERELTKDEIMDLVEFSSIAEHKKIDPQRGFNAQILFEESLTGYSLLEENSESTFGYRSKIPFMKIAQSAIKYLTNGNGTLFSLVVMKP